MTVSSVDAATAADAGAVMGALEEKATRSGAEEVYVAIAPDLEINASFRRVAAARDLGARFAIRMTVAYKGNWIRRTRTFTRGAAETREIDDADARFASIVSRIDPQRPLGRQISGAIADLPGASVWRRLAETTIGTRPLSPFASDEAEQVSFNTPSVVLTMNLRLESGV